MPVIFKGKSPLKILNPTEKIKLPPGEILRMIVVTDIKDQKELVLQRIAAEMIGLPLKNHPYQYFLHQDQDDLRWVVSENKTGMKVAKSLTRKAAKDFAVEKLLTVTAEDYASMLKIAMGMAGGYINGRHI